MNNIPLNQSWQRGASMIEVLVTIVILSFGLLSLAGVQARLQKTGLEAYQRSQAMLLLEDMAQRITVNRRVALPFAVLLALHLAGLVFAFASGRHIDQPDTFPIVVYFALSNVAMLWVCLLVSMDIRRARVFPRFEHRLPFELAWDGGSLAGETTLLSESEVTIPPQRVSGRLPGRATLCLPSLELMELPAT